MKARFDVNAPMPAGTKPPLPEPTQAVRDVLAERRRQIEAEGWTPEHDDAEHDTGDFAAACAAYALHAADQLNPHSQGDGGGDAPHFWPFEASWWKPTTPRRDLVKALALGLAELERIDRAEQASKAFTVVSCGQHPAEQPADDTFRRVMLLPSAE